MVERAKKGGLATAESWERERLTEDELGDLLTLEDAKVALNQVRVGVLTGRISHAESNAATKAVSEWVKTEAALLTKSLVNELQGELNDKAKEIDQLRTELARARVRAS